MKNIGKSIMIKTRSQAFIPALVCLIILLPACQSGRKEKPVAQPSKIQATKTVLPKDYKQRKQALKERQKLKDKARKELPGRIKDMNKDQLAHAVQYYLELDYLDMAIKHLEQLIIVTTEAAELKERRLHIADLYFEMGAFEKAGKLYARYLEYYPGGDKEEREYVEYKSILCRFYMTLKSDNDQTITKETLQLTQQYLDKGDVYPTYAQDVRTIQQASYHKLMDAETKVAQFYIRRNKFKAAEKRLAHIKNNYLPYAYDFEPDLLTTEIQLADAQGYTQLAHEKRIELAVKFPQNAPLVASGPKVDYVTKF